MVGHRLILFSFLFLLFLTAKIVKIGDWNNIHGTIEIKTEFQIKSKDCNFITKNVLLKGRMNSSL